MKVNTPGHSYELANFERKELPGQIIKFINKKSVAALKAEGIEISIVADNTDLVTVHDGTTNEEVLEMLIDRLSYLQELFPCKENACAITHLQEALMWLEKRTADRIKRNVEGKNLK